MSEFSALPFAFAKRHQLLVQPIAGGQDDGDQKLVIYCEKLPSAAVYSELCRYYGAALELEQVAAQVLSDLMSSCYEASSSAAKEVMAEIDASVDLPSLQETMQEAEDLLEQEDEAPIVRLINALLAEAIQRQASDIHLETFEKTLSVRFRVDGVLREVAEPKRSLANLLISRIKIMAGLDIAEKRVPQDGRISLKLGGREVDVRVSTLPSIYGERVVLRLLDKQAERMDLLSLGLSAEVREGMGKLLQLSHGIILVTGPTGSGKTTTLYAGLNKINNREKNILTVEDPVEYHIQGLGQTQVNNKAGMTFARGLRAILRQDPDIVMVGEIRDIETMQIAVQASLTGHLVLSTLHTNSAVGAVTRLMDMGVEPFLLSSSLSAVMAQRLVRKLCGRCKQAHHLTAAECQHHSIDPAHGGDIFQAAEAGCVECDFSGFRGRTGIYELIVVDQHLRQLIHDGATEAQMLKHARQFSHSIQQDGLRKVLAGETSLAEVLRVVQEV